MANPYGGQYQQPSNEGQGYRHPDPKISGHHSNQNAPPHQHSAYDRDGYPVAPGAPVSEQYDPSYFPPPPRSEYSAGGAERSHAQSEAREDDGQALTPYDEEKAYAQYTDRYGPPDYGGQRPSAPSSEYDRSRYDDRRYDDRQRHDERERRRPPPSESDYDYDYEDDRRYDSRPPRAEDDRRRREKRKPSPTKGGGKDIFRQGDGERGLASTILGGAAGAFLGNEVGHKGTLGTLGGALVGAIGANALEKQYDKRKDGKLEDKNRAARRSHQDEYAVGGADPYNTGRGSDRDAVGRDEFRPRRADARGEPRRRRRREESLSDEYSSDER